MARNPVVGALVLVILLVVPARPLASRLGIAATGLSGELLGMPLVLGVYSVLYWMLRPLGLTLSVWYLIVVGAGAVLSLGVPRAPRLEIRSMPRVLWLALVGTAMLALILVSLSGRDSDDFAYGAIVADYVAGIEMGTQDAVLGDDVPMFPRQVINVWLALIASAAGVAGVTTDVFIQDLLPLVAAAITLASVFSLGSLLGRSDRWGAISVVVAIAWYGATPLHSLPGSGFLARIGQDKFFAAYAVLPLIFSAFLAALDQRPSVKKVSLTGALAGLGLVGVHPVIYTISGSALVVWLLLSMRSRREFRLLLFSLAFFAIGLVPVLVTAVETRELGPPEGSELSQELEAKVLNTESPFGEPRLIFGEDERPISVHPRLISQPLTTLMLALGLLAPIISPMSRTKLVAATILAAFVFVFNPLLTPLLSDIVGVNMVWRWTLILPVPFALASLGSVIDENLPIRKQTLKTLIVSGFLILSIQAPLLPEAIQTWRESRERWRVPESLEDVGSVLDEATDGNDMVIASGGLAELQLPTLAPTTDFLAFRGILGTVTHFPRDQSSVAERRYRDWAAFTKPTGETQFTQEDWEILGRWDVTYFVLTTTDRRYESAKKDPRLRLITEADPWALFAVQSASASAAE